MWRTIFYCRRNLQINFKCAKLLKLLIKYVSFFYSFARVIHSLGHLNFYQHKQPEREQFTTIMCLCFHWIHFSVLLLPPSYILWMCVYKTAIVKSSQLFMCLSVDYNVKFLRYLTSELFFWLNHSDSKRLVKRTYICEHFI